MTKKINEAVTEQDPIAEQEATAVPQLTIQDLQAVVQIIDLGSRRGAYQGNELTQVGLVYDKVAVFLKYIADTQKATEDSGEK